MTARLALMLASLLLAIAVALGAFGAHALKSRLAPDLQAVWQTAVQYHAWHALGLFGVGLYLLHRPDTPLAGWSAWLFVAGIVLFSGSLYALALTGSARTRCYDTDRRSGVHRRSGSRLRGRLWRSP